MKRYFRALVRRTLRLAIPALLAGLIMLAAVGAVAAAAVGIFSQDSVRLVTAGVTGDLDNSYVKMAVFTVKNIDIMQFYIDLVEVNDRAEGLEMLKNGEIDCLVEVPDGFVSRLLKRDPVKVVFTVPELPSGFGTVLIKQISGVIEKIVAESQNGIYSMEVYAESVGYDGELYIKADAIAADYVSLILGRENMLELSRVNRAGIGLDGYYFCAFATFFAFLWGIGCFACLHRPDRSLNRLLFSKGLGCARQILCELAAHYLPSLVFFALAALSASFFLPLSLAGLLAVLTVFVLCFCTLHLLFYELFSDTLGAVLSQFVFALFGSFVSGCFYPSWFFPETAEALSSFFPAGAGMKLLQSGYAGAPEPSYLFICLCWSAVFFACAVLARRARLRGDSP